MVRTWKLLSLTLMSLALSACPSGNRNYYPTAGKSDRSLTVLVPDALQSNVWPAISTHFVLDDSPDHDVIQQQIKSFLRHPAYINELSSNAKPYLYYVFQETKKRHMPAEIALLPMIESNYTPFGISSTGATGLWQMMPGTASGFGININWWYDGRRDIKASTTAALNYLAYLHNHFNNWMLAIAAYDSGEGTVEMAIKHNKRLGKPTNYWDLPLPYETKMYVPKLLALTNIIANASEYHIKLPKIPNRPYFKSVIMHKQIDLAHAAKLSNTPLDTIRTLNPGFRRWATVPHQTYTLLLPLETSDINIANLQNEQLEQTTWIHHKVKPGESLYAISDRFKTHTKIIKKVNHLSTSTIHPKQDLLIPLTGKNLNFMTAEKIPADIAEDKIPGPRRVDHLVSVHDNLWTIAAKYHVTPDQIRYWNDMPYSQNILKVNKTLVIWVQHHFKHSPFYTYQVQSGDNLSLIAEKFGTHTKTLQRINHLNGNLIRVGLTLNIPKLSERSHPSLLKTLHNQMITHVVRAGDTLDSIAHYYEVPLKKLMAWNHLKENKKLSVGNPLHIYLK